MYYLLHFTGVLLILTETSSSLAEDAERASNRSTNMSTRYGDDHVPRRRKIDGLWPVYPNSSSTHENELELDTRRCPNKLCNCEAMAVKSYQSCMCTDKNASCWFDGTGCFCKYDGRYCISAWKGDHAACPVRGVYAAVCQVNKTRSTIKLQCLPSGTETPCDLMSCRYMRLLEDGSYQAVTKKPGTNVIVVGGCECTCRASVIKLVTSRST